MNLQFLIKLMSKGQFAAFHQGYMGEERQAFVDIGNSIEKTFNAMPETYKGDDTVHLHYFKGGIDIYITEKDKGSPDDKPGDFQIQMYGYTNLGYGFEKGYISLPEILRSGLELDFHFKPKPFDQIKR